MPPKPVVHVVGAGLAGSEAAYFLAERGVSVYLHEMRPVCSTPAHETPYFAELVCSNSFKSQDPQTPAGLLKEEMGLFPSLVLKVAQEVSLPAGQALAVDRLAFSKRVTTCLENHPNIQILREEVVDPAVWESPGTFCILATGPLTSDTLSAWWVAQTGQDSLFFYDAIAPIVEASTLNLEKGFFANRYEKGGEVAYLNFPLSQAEYEHFVSALLSAQTVPLHTGIEKECYFQACQPIEVIAASGKDSLRFGPMKPVGLLDPRTGRRPHAVLQLRPENTARSAYNLVGFQTKLTYGEQKRIFSLLPGLEKVEFLRLGSIHRNTYVKGPEVLSPNLSLQNRPSLFLAGQITGVEGYLESAACGLLAGFFVWEAIHGRVYHPPPLCSAMGALLHHVTQDVGLVHTPSHVHFGLLYVTAEKQFPGLFSPEQKTNKDAVRAFILKEARSLFLDWRHQW